MAKLFGTNESFKVNNTESRIKAIVSNLDVASTDNAYSYLYNEGMAMREYGFTYSDIEEALADKLELLGLRA